MDINNFINDDKIFDKDILKAVFQECSTVFLVNLETDEATILYCDEYVKQHYTDILSSKISYSAGMHIFVERQVYPEDQQIIYEISKVENLKEVLKQKHTFTVIYRTLYEGKIKYCQVKIMKIGDDAIPKKIVALFQDCDEEIQKQFGYRENLNNERKNAELAKISKSTFLFNMSHDLRTPMNAIMGLTELAKKHINDSNRVYECLEKIGFASDNLLCLINDILDMTRLETGKIKSIAEISNIKLVISSLMEMIKPSADLNEISLECKYIDVVHTNLKIDVLHLNQILLNIIDNAIKYSRPKSVVELIITEIDSNCENAATYEFQIKDSGIGIHQDFIGQIFEPFSREKNSTMCGISGTGLGMPITKKLVQLLKGKISVESEKNKGTCFTLTFNFPIQTKQKKVMQLCDIKKSIKEKSDLSKLTVLIVEDNKLNREIAKDILIDNNINVIEAENGEIAVELMKKSCETEENKIDAVLMDIQMPVMDGYEATKKIRAFSNENIAKIPIIALTANTFEEDKKNCFAVGMNDHISKPVSSKKLIEILKNYCS